ncbi:tumor necrosis factor alpha-induced protein 2a isoform X1 [Channa argus]|uniref:tumor necrosis factor alpha-induced protein 2a isoform X1 n=1 Tax=Channa argus TaxID=215402 RepID=UPI0035227292
MFSFLVSRECQQTGVQEDSEGGERRKLPKLKIPAQFRRNRKEKKPDQTAEDALDCVEEHKEEQLEQISRRLIIREEQLFTQDCPCEQDEDQLHKDLEALLLQIWMAVHNSFTSPSSPGELEVLRSAVASIQQQEVQDRRWMGCVNVRVPCWRPQKCLSNHNVLLQNMVQSRMKIAAEDDWSGTDGPSSPVKNEVLRMGKCLKKDLLTVVRAVMDCYPPHMDILNVYAGLYHQSFSARLTELAAPGLDVDDCSYVLLWVNHRYPYEILKHEELDGKVKVACLGSLLLTEDLNRLEEQYLTYKEDKVKLWLSTVLEKEEQSWMKGNKPEILSDYFFSPLAVDVIQIIQGSLTEFSCVIRDQSKAERITVHLENFLSSYKMRLEEFVKGNHRNVLPVIKAHLVCEEQLSEYISGQTGRLSEQQRQRCLDTLSALRDCGHKCFTCPIQAQVKVGFSELWTPIWLDRSLPVVDSVLEYLNQQLTDLTDLKSVCRKSLLHVIHQDVALKYVNRMMKARMKNREQEVAGAQRMIEDAQNISDFFTERGCTEASWLREMLFSIAEMLRLQDPGSVQLEMVSLVRTFPDLSNAHVLALLSLKPGLSAAHVRAIRRSVEDNRRSDGSANHSPPFFSKVKVKWISNKMNQMGLKS